MTEGIAAAQVATREVDLAAGWTIGGFLRMKKDIDFSGFFLLALSNSCSSLVNFYLLLKGKKSHNLCWKESEYTQYLPSLLLVPYPRYTINILFKKIVVPVLGDVVVPPRHGPSTA